MTSCTYGWESYKLIFRHSQADNLSILNSNEATKRHLEDYFELQILTEKLLIKKSGTY